MARVVLPDLFVLGLGLLSEAAQLGLVQRVEDKYGELLEKAKHHTREPGEPVSLRWVLNPLLGFPRAPFEIWRRRRTEEPTVALLGGATLGSPSVVSLPVEVLEIRFVAIPDPGRTVTVEALSRSGRVLPGQQLVFGGARPARFRAPGINALSITGNGHIVNVAAIVQGDWANLPDWERIEVVGFPFETGELPGSAYDPAIQGWEAPSLSGPDAALLRMGVAALLQLDPPPVGAGGLVAPPWPAPDPGVFLDVLRKGPLDDVARCLMDTDDMDPAHLQAGYVVDRAMPGLRQPGQPPGPDPATLGLTTTQYIGLAVNDSPVALGLGFGTTDIPPIARYQPKEDLLPAGTTLSPWEYMATASFVVWPGVKLDLAAIGQHVPPPVALAGLATQQTFYDRATQTDGLESVAVQVSWSAPLRPAGEALLSRRPPGGTDLVNPARPAGAGGFEPYLTEHRLADDGLPPANLRPGVTVPAEPVPVSGSATTFYGVAPLDAHGRWGPWRLTSHTANAREVQRPGLHSVGITLPEPLPGTPPVVAGATLMVEFSWDWADRSLDRVLVHGAFVPLGPPPASVSGFQADVQGTAGAPLVVLFSLSGVPSVPAPATVAEVSDPVAAGASPGGSSDPRRYRLRIPTMRLAFGASDELGYAVAIQGAERVRPAAISAPVGPLATTVADPYPAAIPPLPPVQVLWTALPDALGRARAVLSWPSVPGAAGYIVWEATEAAVFHAVSGGGTPAPGQTIRARAGDIKTRIAANQDASQGAFSRLDERPLTVNSRELVLPGAADTLFLYRISTITRGNVESGRSTDVVTVGVPRRDVPAIPRLEALADPGGGGVTLTVVALGGPPPERIRVHRVRRLSLADQVGTMGPPRIGPLPVASLPTVQVPGPDGRTDTGWQLHDTVTPGWQPYVYRCVAIGRDEPDEGIHAGETASGVVRVLVPPPAAPLVTGAARLAGPAGVLVTFNADLPWVAGPAGSGRVSIARVEATPGGVTRQVLATLASVEIPQAPAPDLTGPPATDAVATRRPPLAGVAEVSVLLPAPVTGAVVLTATDPRGRSTIVELP